MSPAARLTLGAIQSLNSTNSTLRPCFLASSTAASSGMAKAAVVPTFSGASAAKVMELKRPRARASALTGRERQCLVMMVFQSIEGLWRGSLLPLGCAAAPKPFNEVCQLQPYCRCCDCCAVEREHAPSPQGLASESGTSMLLRQMRLALKQLLAQAAGVVSGLVRPATLQLRNHPFNKIHIAFRGDDPGQVEAIKAR